MGDHRGRSRSRSRSPAAHRRTSDHRDRDDLAGSRRESFRERERERDRDRDRDRDRGRGRGGEGWGAGPEQPQRRWGDDSNSRGPPPGHGGPPPPGRRGPGPMPPGPGQTGPQGDNRRPSVVLKPLEPVDREKTCPLLLRIFCKVGGHHREDEFANGRVPHNDELIMHTWLDASLKELSTLIREVVEEARPKGTRLEFSVVYPTPKGQIVMKELGIITTGRRSEMDLLALGQTRFKIGDYLDVAVVPNNDRRGPPPGRRDY